jgi:hypothetical protein
MLGAMSAPDGPAGDLDRPPPVEGEAIAGVVRDVQGVPMTGVRVEAAESGGADLDLLPELTDGEGAFRIEGLAAGRRYDLRFSIGQVKARALGVPVGTDELVVKLARPQGVLLDVKTEPGSIPPEVHYVMLERETPEGPRREYADRSLRGRLMLSSIRPGRYSVTVWGGPYLPVRADGIVVRENEPAPHVEVLLAARGGVVGGEVFDAEGEPREAYVSWRRLDAPGHAPLHMTTSRTDPHGAFVLRGLPGGRYRISAWSAAAGLADADLDVGEEESVALELRLRP